VDFLKKQIRKEALKCSRFFNRVSFNDCFSLAVGFPDVPKVPAIYAIKTQSEILYVGQSTNVWKRFKNGHSTLMDILIDGYAPADLRIAVMPISPFLIPHLKAIEDRVIFAFRPPYNGYIPKLGS
jgi:hypothetical protein